MNLKPLCAALIISCLSSPGHASSIQSPDAPQLSDRSQTYDVIRKRINRLISSSGFKPNTLGIWVGDVTEHGREVVFELNSSQSFIPASLSKLVTAAAVLDRLHPSYRYKTELLSEANVTESGILKGNLYLRGGGDPSFVSENMWFLVNELTRTGIKKIEGDIVVDDGRFDRIRIDEDRESVRVDRAYDAPVGAMSMNWNSVNVYVRPGNKAGEPARVFLDPQTPYLKLINQAKTSGAKGARSISVERISEKGFTGDVIRVSGSIPEKSSEIVSYKNISQPDLWSGHNLAVFLRQREMSFAGQVRTGVAPASAQLLAVYESKPLAAIVADMSKFSNNYVAEMLIKNLAAEAGQRPASMSEGMKAISSYLDRVGLKKGEYSFVNAAGFSRQNKMRPAQIGLVLEQMRSNFSSYPEFLTSLPIGGVDGTLKSRMKNSPAERWVRAKTGLLNGVIGLAGYAGRKDGLVKTFVFVYNGSGREDQARLLFDRLAAALVED